MSRKKQSYNKYCHSSYHYGNLKIRNKFFSSMKKRREIAQALILRFLIPIRQISSCGICGGWNGTTENFLRVPRIPLPISIPTTAPYSLIVLSSNLYSLDTDSVVMYPTCVYLIGRRYSTWYSTLFTLWVTGSVSFMYYLFLFHLTMQSIHIKQYPIGHWRTYT